MEHRVTGAPSVHTEDFVGQLYQRTSLSLITYVHRYVPSREDAEDIVLEVYLAALQQPDLAKLSEEQQMAWLQRVAYYKYVDYQRHKSVRQHITLFDGSIETLSVDEHPGPEELLLRAEEDSLLRQRLSELPVDYQKVLQLRFAIGMRSREIAQHMQKSDGAIRMLLTRALNSLRELYTRRDTK